MTAKEKRRAYMAAYHKKHKEREKAARRARIAADPEKYLAAQRRYYYGLPKQQADALLASQGGKCAICRTDNPGGRGVWHLDHDHVTQAIRGFLCPACNSGLGFFRDDPLRLALASDYLQKHGKAKL